MNVVQKTSQIKEVEREIAIVKAKTRSIKDLIKALKTE